MPQKRTEICEEKTIDTALSVTVTSDAVFLYKHVLLLW